MFNKFEGKFEKAREMILGPREVQFENGIKLITRIGKDEPVLKFMKGNEEVFDLKNLLPEGTEMRFDPDDKWQASAGMKELCIGKFTGADCVLSFLHEVGHLKRPEDEDITNSAKARYNNLKFNKEDATSIPSEELLNNASKEIIQGERNAWAYSLREARKLEKKYGINILGEIGNARQVKEFVDSFLSTYKESYSIESKSLDIFSEEEIEEFLVGPETNNLK